MRTFTLVFFVLGFSIASAADDKDAPEIQALMAPEDFSASGLDKLTDAERAHLSGWVARYREGAIIGPTVPGKQREEAAAAAARETTPEPTSATTQEYPGGYTTQEQKQKEKDKNVDIVTKPHIGIVASDTNKDFADSDAKKNPTVTSQQNINKNEQAENKIADEELDKELDEKLLQNKQKRKGEKSLYILLRIP